MNEDTKKTSGKTATAELEDNAAAEPRVRSTTAGLGTFDKITSIASATSGFGIAPGLSSASGATKKPTAMDTIPGITGVDLSFSEGMPGTTTHPTQFTEAEDDYWRQSYASRPYSRSGSTYDEYRPAYQYGTDAAHRHQGRRWEDVEGDLESGWGEARGTSRSTWHEIKAAVRDAWDRVTGGSDHHR
jgi:hypothetical protein